MNDSATITTNRNPIGEQPRIALALSGGGFRASLFHLGVLRRLAEARRLDTVDVISTVSGGSVIGAFAALRWQGMLADGGDWPALDKHIVTPFLDVITSKNFIVRWLSRLPWSFLMSRVDVGFSRTAVGADLFDRWFFHGATLDQLPPRPRLVLNATSLPSIRAWQFTHDGMGDTRYGYTQWANQAGTPPRVSLAVSASAAFPPVFTPVRIRLEEYQFGPPLYGEHRPDVTNEMPLSDGGVYDNLGLEVLVGSNALPGGSTVAPPKILVVSDAGHPAAYRFTGCPVPLFGALTLLGRVRDVALEQVAAQRRRTIVDDFKQERNGTKGILVSIASRVSKLKDPVLRAAYVSAVGAHSQIPAALLSMIQTVRTSLDTFSHTEAEALMYHAYTMTDAFWWAYLTSEPRPAPNPDWRIAFDGRLVATWARELTRSGEQLRLR